MRRCQGCTRGRTLSPWTLREGLLCFWYYPNLTNDFRLSQKSHSTCTSKSIWNIELESFHSVQVPRLPSRPKVRPHGREGHDQPRPEKVPRGECHSEEWPGTCWRNHSPALRGHQGEAGPPARCWDCSRDAQVPGVMLRLLLLPATSHSFCYR